MSNSENGFVAVAKAADIPPGGIKCVAVEGERVVVAQVDGRFYALRDRCGHKHAPLSRGRLAGHLIECPLHFAKFDIRNGRLVDGPVSADVAVYETRLLGDTVLVRTAATP